MSSVLKIQLSVLLRAYAVSRITCVSSGFDPRACDIRNILCSLCHKVVCHLHNVAGSVGLHVNAVSSVKAYVACRIGRYPVHFGDGAAGASRSAYNVDIGKACLLLYVYPLPCRNELLKVRACEYMVCRCVACVYYICGCPIRRILHEPVAVYADLFCAAAVVTSYDYSFLVSGYALNISEAGAYIVVNVNFYAFLCVGVVLRSSSLSGELEVYSSVSHCSFYSYI